MAYQQQKELIVSAIEKIKKLEHIESVSLKILDEGYKIEDGIEKVSPHFPYKIIIEYTIPNVGDMTLYLETNDDYTSFEKIEIFSIDVKKFYRFKGYGRILIEQAKIVMKAFGAYSYGNYMNEYSKEFYIHCGFAIDENKRQFRMECN